MLRGDAVLVVFSSLHFIFVFLPIVLIGCFVVKPIKFKNYFLLLASLIFYAWGEPKFIIVMVASILMNYAMGRIVAIRRTKGVLALAIVLNLLILFIFKYLNFAISNIDNLFNDIFPQTEISLPIGISFFTFQAMSYVIDVYRGDAKVQRNPLYLGLYISLFPQLIAGPIVRYSHIEEQIESRCVTADEFGEGVRRFVIGLGKKVVIANNIALIADFSFNSFVDGTQSVMAAWLGAISYAMQIYFDFAGYSDMAIGLGLMLGFKFDENFIYPYSKGSIKGFWSENHISLCSWFRDYVYIPLGGSRRGNVITYRNMLIVWVITGIWHGASWTFLIWGLAYFVLLAVERALKIPDSIENTSGKLFYRIFCLIMLVILNGVLFRDLGAAETCTYLGTMFGISNAAIYNSELIFVIHEYWVFLAIAIVYAASVFNHLANRLKSGTGRTAKAFNVFSNLAYAMILVISLSFLVMNDYNPFIYFNF